MKCFAPVIRFVNGATSPEVCIYDTVVSERQYEQQKFWMNMDGGDAEPAVMTANKFRNVLNAGDFKNASDITVRINSQGGDVSGGMAIYNTLVEHPAKVKVVVDGEAVSIASVILQAGDTREISRGGMVMIHDPAGEISGCFSIKDLRSTADALEVCRTNIINVYKERTGNTEANLSAWMAGEKWMTAQQAVDLKFVDSIVDRSAKFLNYVRPGLKNRPSVPNQFSSDSAKRRARQLAMLNLH